MCIEIQPDIHSCGITMFSGKRDIPVDLDDDDHQRRSISGNMEMMAYALSHDLRAPLRAIDGFSSALIEDLGESLPEAAAHDLREIRAGIQRMHSIISKWQSLVRGGGSPLQDECVDLSALAQSIINELRIAEPSRKVMTQIAAGLQVRGDAVLLREMLQNLLGNAWKFTQQNDAQALIEFGMVSHHGHYFVRDNGIGLATDTAHDIFKPMTRLANAAGVEGSGMGLAIVRYIVEVHGGAIWLAPSAGQGATFNFTLPGA